MHAQLSSGALSLNYGLSLHLRPEFVYVSKISRTDKYLFIKRLILISDKDEIRLSEAIAYRSLWLYSNRHFYKDFKDRPDFSQIIMNYE